MKKQILFAALVACAAASADTFVFRLDTMPEGAHYALDTMPDSSMFYVETMADAYGVRTITNAVQVLPVSHWGSGTLTFAHEGGATEVAAFSEDGTETWRPTQSGRWTVTTTGGTPSGSSSATFVLLGGAADVETVGMTGLAFGEDSSVSFEFEPTLKDGASMDGTDWFSAAKASGLLKARAATTLEALDSASATILDLDDLGAVFDPATGKVTFSLTAEQMSSVDPSAKSMFFKVEVR